MTIIKSLFSVLNELVIIWGREPRWAAPLVSRQIIWLLWLCLARVLVRLQDWIVFWGLKTCRTRQGLYGLGGAKTLQKSGVMSYQYNLD